jgi:pescadillo protein
MFNHNQENQISDEFKDAPEFRELRDKEEQAKLQRQLFSKCRFFLSRETPIYALQYLIISFGGSFTLNKDDKAITHLVLDRPTDKKNVKQECVQPQWIADSINHVVLLPTLKYFPGVPPPSHLSPFVDNKKEGYIPER